jgi:hypothetical protein
LKNTGLNKVWRKTSQYLLPDVKPVPSEGSYDIYPAFKLEENQISEGFESLAEAILKHKTVIIDGYIGVFYDHYCNKLDEYLKKKGIQTSWKSTFD